VLPAQAMKYQEIREQEHKDINALYINMGVFWAFSNSQFDENKTPLLPGEKYVSIGAGGYMPKHNVEALLQGSKDIHARAKQQIKDNKAREAHIIYELSNHETYYTGDITNALDALGQDYTSEEVLKVFNVEKKNHYND
jgi:hypothetical protein